MSLFDPTIYDNLKVVLEGHLYDMDAEGSIKIESREDLVDLAGMARAFRMRFVLGEGRQRCRFSITLRSGLTDFAGELRGLHAAGEQPGANLELRLDMPGDLAEKRREIHNYISGLWGEDWHIRHEQLTELSVDAGEDEQVSSYRVFITYSRKINEDHMESLEDMLEHLHQHARWINQL